MATTNERLAIVRLHGRNEETWDIQGATVASDRFNYEYTDLELDHLARRIEEIAAAVQETHVVLTTTTRIKLCAMQRP